MKLSPEEYRIQAFKADEHGPFVYDSFVRSLHEQFPWSEIPVGRLDDIFKRILADPETTTLVALDNDGDTILGWMCARKMSQEVVFGFTRYATRRMGIGSSLLIACGIDPMQPFGVRFWSRACERISMRPGWSLFCKMTGAENE